jgi:hypothetical protein
MDFNYTDGEGKIDPAQGKKVYGGVQVLIHVFLTFKNRASYI